MVIDFSKINYDDKPVLVLRNLDGRAIQTLGYAFNIQCEFCYNEVSTLTFDLPKYVDGVETPHYNDVVGMRIIDLHEVGQFILVDPEEYSDGIKTIKSCKAYSLEYEFSNKNITLESGTYNFWNPLLPKDTIIGRILEKMPDWSIANVDEELIGRYRTFEVTEDSMYNFIKSEVQKSYGCIFEFDTYKREINVISVNSEVETKPIYLSKERLIKEINISEDSNHIVTCLDVNGADGVNIRGVNPTGTNKIYNLDYFMNTTNFTEAFIEKWGNWKNACENYQTIYYNTTIEYNLQTSRHLAEQAILTDLQGDLTNLENQQAVIIEAISQKLKNNSDLTEINKKISDKKAEISEQKNKIERIDVTISELNETIKNINATLAINQYFTSDELSLLQKYFIEDAIEDSTFSTSTTATYDNEDVNISINDIELSVTNSDITTTTDSNGKILKTICGGKLNIGTLSAEIVKAHIDLNTDKSFIMTAHLNKGTIGEAEFESGSVTLIGNYNLTTETSSALSFKISDGTLYFTQNTTEYEQHMIEWDLYEYGKQVLSDKAFPTYEFSIDSGNFLAVEDFITFKNALTLGKKVYLKLDDNDEVMKPYVITVRINYEDASDFELEFSSTYKSSKQFALVDLLEESISMGRKLNSKSGLYEQFVSSGASTAVKDFMDSALDIAKNTVMSSGHQAIEFGDSGIRVRKWKDDNHIEYEDEQIWIVDNMIAFTEDNWDSSCMAIGKIFDESFGDYEPATSTYDSSKVYCYRSGEQEPYTYKPYTYNAENWDTEWNKLYCRKGGVKYGIAAPYLVGTILAGKNLFIGTDGGYFRVDDNGVYVLNEKFVIASSNGNGLTFTADEGLVHRVNADGKKYEAGFSAANNNGEGYGLYFKVGNDKKLYFDVDSAELVVDGDIWARDVFFGADKKSVMTINDKGNEAISGNYLDLKGILVKDSTGRKRFSISGNGGGFEVYDGYIYMTNGNNEININPNEGLLFTKNGNEIVKLDINDGSAVFSGTVKSGNIISDTTIDVNTVATIGEKLVLQDQDEHSTGHTNAADISVDTGTMYINANNGRSINISTVGRTGGNIQLNAGTTGGAGISMKADNIGGKPKVYANNKRVLVDGDLNDLYNSIDDIQTDIASLWNAINALRNSSNPSVM